MQKQFARFRKKQQMQTQMYYNLSTMPNNRVLRQRYNTKRMPMPY